MKCGESGEAPPKRKTLGWHGQEGRALRTRMVRQLQCDRAEGLASQDWEQLRIVGAHSRRQGRIGREGLERAQGNGCMPCLGLTIPCGWVETTGGRQFEQEGH